MSLSFHQSASDSSGKLRQKLSSEWSIFIGAICSPWLLILAALTIVLIICSVSLNAPVGSNTGALQAFLAVMISIFSGLIGAVLTSRWSEAGETNVLITRGKS